MSHFSLHITKQTAPAQLERFDRSCEREYARTLVRRLVRR